MEESNTENFNHLKIHSQFSICEGAIKIDDLKDISKDKKLKALGLCDTSNLCGALEFAEKLSKSGSQPIIGTQINFKLNDTTGLLPLFALNEYGYKTIIKLSSLSFLKNDELSDPHLDFNELLKTVRNSTTIDWTIKESVQAELRRNIRRVLRKSGYPPDLQEKAVDTVITQAKMLADDLSKNSI